MEKIQQALERARQQRKNSHSEAGVRNDDNVDAQSINYTQTQSLEGQTELQRENRILSAMEHSEYVDAFKMLSTQVKQRMDDHHWSSIMVTSVGHSEGKTTAAINLGISLAKEIEYTVLLVDGNLKKPNLHNHFGIESEYGLSDYLTKDIDLSNIFFRPEGTDHFVILPGGSPLSNSAEMLASPKMCSLVEELKDRYPKRVVIFDMPPILTVADTVSFAPCVDCALVVVEDDATKQADLERAIDLISVTNVLGTVLNKVRY